MSKASDISNLYQRVDGNPSHYRELEEARQTEFSRERWPMMSAIRPGTLGVRPVRDDVLAATHEPAPTGLEPVAQSGPPQPWESFAPAAPLPPAPVSSVPVPSVPVAIFDTVAAACAPSAPTFFMRTNSDPVVPPQAAPVAPAVPVVPVSVMPAVSATQVAPARQAAGVAPVVPPMATPAPVFAPPVGTQKPAAVWRSTAEPAPAVPLQSTLAPAFQPAAASGLKGLFARLDRGQSDKEPPQPPARNGI